MALTLPLLFGMTALVVDGATLMAKKRGIQNAADAAALAAAQVLPASGQCTGAATDPYPSSCQSKLLHFVNHYSHDVNGGPTVDHACAGPSDTNCYTNPYSTSGPPSDQLVEVRLRESVATLFTGTVGLGNAFNVSARAVGSALAQTTVIPGSTTPVTSLGSTIPGNTVTNYTTVTSTTVTGGIGAVAYANSTACKGPQPSAAITYSGAGGGEIGALVTPGGIDVGGNGAQKTIDAVALGGFWNDSGTPQGNPQCYQDTTRFTLVNPPVHHWTQTQPPITPPAYPTPGAGCSPVSDPIAPPVTTKALSGGFATLTTSANHGLNVGDDVLIALSPADSRFDGWHTLTTGTKNKTLMFAASGTQASVASAGSVTPTSQSFTISASGGVPAWALTHPPGIYCITGTTASLSLSNADLSEGPNGAACAVGATNCGYTFFAPSIGITSGTYRCYRYCNPDPSPGPSVEPYPTLFYSSTNISSSGSSPSLEGYIFAPNGSVSFTGGGGAGGSGFIEAQTLSFAGNFNTYSGRGPVIGATTSTSTTTLPVTTITNPDIINPGSTTTIVTPPTTQVTGTTIGLGE